VLALARIQKFSFTGCNFVFGWTAPGEKCNIWIKVGSSCKETAAWKGLHMRKSSLRLLSAIFFFMLVAVEIWDGRQGISN
jgi:hypothetical protein